MKPQNNGHRHIWLLSGIGEGPKLAKILTHQGWDLTVSVVSLSASWPYSELSLTSVLVGPLDGVQAIKRLLKKAREIHQGFDLVIDATHPFAVEISSNLQKACSQLGQPLLRFERPLEHSSGAFLIEDLKDLSKYSLYGKNVLMALGARHLNEAVSMARKSGADVFARVLPTPESLKQCLKCLIKDNDFAALRPFQGSCLGDFEKALCRLWSINLVICRQSGGLNQRLWEEICQKENIQLWLISRPVLDDETEVVDTFNAVLDRIRFLQ